MEMDVDLTLEASHASSYQVCEMCREAKDDVFPYINDDERPDTTSEDNCPKQLCQTCVSQMNMCDDLINFLDKTSSDIYTQSGTKRSTNTEEEVSLEQSIIESEADKSEKDLANDSDDVLKSILNLYNGDSGPELSRPFSPITPPPVMGSLDMKNVGVSTIQHLAVGKITPERDNSTEYQQRTNDKGEVRRLSAEIYSKPDLNSKNAVNEKIDSRRSSASDVTESGKTSTAENFESRLCSMSEENNFKTVLSDKSITNEAKVSQMFNSKENTLDHANKTKNSVTNELASDNAKEKDSKTSNSMKDVQNETNNIVNNLGSQDVDMLENTPASGIDADNVHLSVDPKELFSIHGLDLDLPVKCDFCEEKFFDLDKFDKHIILHREAHFFSCQLCTSTYLSWNNLVAHRKACHQGEIISCDPCSNRKNHPNLGPVNYSVSGYPVACEECDEGFSNVAQLYRHYRMKLMHGTKGIRVYFNPSVIEEKEGSDEETLDKENEDSTEKEKIVWKQKSLLRTTSVKFTCPVCNTNFCSSQELAIHMSKLAEDFVPNTCEVCNMKFCNARMLDLHMKTHPKSHVTPSYLCSVCGKTFKSRSAFDAHRLWHDGVKRYKCNWCLKRFSKRSTLESHKYIHPVREVYRCKDCILAVDNVDDLRAHISEKHKNEDDKITCDICDEQHAVKNFIEHYKSCHFQKEKEQMQIRQLNVTCPICFKVFSQPATLKRHLYLHNPNLNKHHVCEICNKTIIYHNQILSHARSHYGDDLPPKYHSFVEKVKNRMQKKVLVEKTFVCEFCSKEFHRKKSFLIHLRRHAGERPFSCQFCNRSFYTKSQLVIHTRMHTGERPYICGICQKTFTGPTSLYLHRKIHSKIRRFVCQYCDKTFMWHSTYIGHLRLHTGEKPFKCKLCDKAFTLRGRLNTHYKMHDVQITNPNYECSLCGESFESAKDLELHNDDLSCSALYTETYEMTTVDTATYETTTVDTATDDVPAALEEVVASEEVVVITPEFLSTV